MSEFDLERAKAGDPIEYCEYDNKWEFCKFLGSSESSDGYLVVERVTANGFRLSYASPASLRMTPKKVTARYRVALFQSSGRLFTASADTEEEAGALSRRLNFIQWITEWKTAEIQPDLTDKETL